MIKTAFVVSCLALALSATALTIQVFPESTFTKWFFHPIDTARVALICVGHQKGERVGNLVCDIAELARGKYGPLPY